MSGALLLKPSAALLRLLRSSSTLLDAARRRHLPLLSQAHDAAMRGAPWSYSDDENETHKACALLAGVAMLQLAKQKSADVRLAMPFDGLLQRCSASACKWRVQPTSIASRF